MAPRARADQRPRRMIPRMQQRGQHEIRMPLRQQPVFMRRTIKRTATPKLRQGRRNLRLFARLKQVQRHKSGQVFQRLGGTGRHRNGCAKGTTQLWCALIIRDDPVVLCRIINHPEGRTPETGHGQDHAKGRQPVRKVPRPVNRVENEGQRRFGDFVQQGRVLGRRLLAHDQSGGKGHLQGARHHRLCRLIRDGDQIVRACFNAGVPAVKRTKARHDLRLGGTADDVDHSGLLRTRQHGANGGGQVCAGVGGLFWGFWIGHMQSPFGR